MPDYYDILDVPRTATVAQIKKKYKELVKIWHPDKHQGSSKRERQDAEFKFKQIMEAYEVLSDPQKKEDYDLGEDIDDDNQSIESSIPEFEFSPDFDVFELDSEIDKDYMTEMLKTIHESIMENEKIMNSYKLNGVDSDGDDSESSMVRFKKDLQLRLDEHEHNQKKKKKNKTKKGSNINMKIKMSLDEMYNGCNKQVRYVRYAKDRKNDRPIVKLKRLSKLRPHEEQHLTSVIELVNVEIKPRSKPGDNIYIKGMGNDSNDFGKITQEPGDLVVKLLAEPHEIFKQEGFNLSMNMKISHREALEGFTRRVVGIGGRPFNIKVEKIRMSNDLHIVKGKGLWISGDVYGDLIIKFTIDLESKEISKDNLINGKTQYVSDADYYGKDESESSDSDDSIVFKKQPPKKTGKPKKVTKSKNKK